MNRTVCGLVIVFCIALGLALAWTVLDLPPPRSELRVQLAAHLHESGVAHPVTAVLLNFRGYDTLLEVAVLLLALLGMLATRHAGAVHEAVSRPDPLLSALTRVLTPLLVLLAAYLLWAGAHQPGGAFQAGAVLAAAGVLLRLAGMLPGWDTPGRALRWGLGTGLLVFLAVAVPGTGGLLHYPPAWAGALILLIEATLSLSLGLILASLFLVLRLPERDAERDR